MIVENQVFLEQVSEEVKPDEVADLRAKLLAEVVLHPNAVGLAAVQIGIPKRAFITRDEPNTEYEGNPGGWKLWINPVIEKTEEEFAALEEGCLSFPKRVVLTKRRKQITVSAQRLPEWSERETFVLYGLDAVIFQHELDHLNGVTMFSRGKELRIPMQAAPKVGRNDPCPCGSGKKFKKCCG